MPRFWSFFLLSVALLAGVAESGNILFFGPFVSKSMIITYTPILKELASHGHTGGEHVVRPNTETEESDCGT